MVYGIVDEQMHEISVMFETRQSFCSSFGNIGAFPHSPRVESIHVQIMITLQPN